MLGNGCHEGQKPKQTTKIKPSSSKPRGKALGSRGKAKSVKKKSAEQSDFDAGRDRIDLGTPRTAAQAAPPPWSSWGEAYSIAADGIYQAWGLITGQCAIRAVDLNHLDRAAAPDWTEAQKALVEHYRDWRRRLTRAHRDHWANAAVNAVVFSPNEPTPANFIRRAALDAAVRAAMDVWIKDR